MSRYVSTLSIMIILICAFLTFDLSVYSQDASTATDQGSDTIADIMVPVITASFAVLGAFLGIYYTGKNALKIEDVRIKEEQRKQDEISRRVMELIRTELLKLVAVFNSINEIDKDREGSAAFVKTLIGLDKQYPRLPIEMKFSTFKPEVLKEVEIAYHYVGDAIHFFNSIYPAYENGKMPQNQLIDGLAHQAKGVVEHLTTAVVALKRN